MIYFDKVTLNSGFSLLLPHCPEKLAMAKVGDKMTLEKRSINSFGLFDTAQPNFHTYYPDVTAEDLKPKDGEFIRPIFRALSETVVHRKYNPIDFGMNGVLKKHMQKLLGQTVYANHESRVGNEIGSVSKVAWQNSYTTEDNIVVPAGINAEFLIDGKSHPSIARGILMDPPSIHSNSVTVSFAWEKSHPKMENEEFHSKLGTFGEDKQMIRRIVTDISAFHETSLVAHGADPFAQLLVDGKGINNPAYAKAVESLSAKTGTQVCFYNYKTDTLSFSEEEEQTETPTPTNHMKELIASIALILALNTETGFATLSDEDQVKKIQEKLKANKADAEALIAANLAKTTLETEKTTLATELATATASVATLTAEVATLTPTKVKLDALVKTKRDNTLRMYKVLNGDSNTAMIAMIQAADESQLTSFETEYQRLMDVKFPGHCNACESTDITHNSAILETPAAPVITTPGKKGKMKKAMSDEEVLNSFSSNHGNVSKLNGIAELEADTEEEE